MIYSADISDSAGSGQGEGGSMFVVMAYCVLQHCPSPIKVPTKHLA